jgi:hypothetical protein
MKMGYIPPSNSHSTGENDDETSNLGICCFLDKGLENPA